MHKEYLFLYKRLPICISINKMLSMLVYYHPSTLLLKTFVYRAWPFVLKNMTKPSYTETPYSVGDSYILYDYIRFYSPVNFGGKCRLKSKVHYSFRLRISRINEIKFLFMLKKSTTKD